jgi:phenylalanyl-tRNA synthetase alpha chain
MTIEKDWSELPNYADETLNGAFARIFRALSDDVAAAETPDQLEELRIKWIGRKAGLLKQISEKWLQGSPPDARKQIGFRFNSLKQEAELQFAPQRIVAAGIPAAVVEDLRDVRVPVRAGIKVLDITLPSGAQRVGVEHPLVKTMAEIVQVFQRLGYSVALGPEVETDFYNFEALNFPPNHPARDTQDTLVVADQEGRAGPDRLLMRTHTSPVQVRSMLEQAPPLRLVIPGKVHRNDAADATHSPVFHQVEGLCVDTNVTFSDLKGTLDYAMKALFGSAVKTRFFPSFFPFTEPSADVQISCIFCGGSGCRKCKHSGWIELLGCGMVDPAVFEAVNRRRLELGREPLYDTRRISGFAFGMGVDRIAMMKYGISDIGLLYSGDMRFLEQFA